MVLDRIVPESMVFPSSVMVWKCSSLPTISISMGLPTRSRLASMDAHPTGTAAVSWANGRIDTFWVDTDRSLIHRAFADGAWQQAGSLGGTLASAPAATAWAVDQLQVFAILDDGALWNRYWDGTSWHPWESLGGELTGSPAASSWGADRIDVFAPGRDGTLWHRWWDGTRWVDWERLPR